MFVNKWNKHLSQKGFSLMELVISVGLVGVLSLGVSHVMRQQALSKRSIEKKTSVRTFATGMQHRLFRNDTAICQQLFNGINANAATMTFTRAHQSIKDYFQLSHSIMNH